MSAQALFMGFFPGYNSIVDIFNRWTENPGKFRRKIFIATIQRC